MRNEDGFSVKVPTISLNDVFIKYFNGETKESSLFQLIKNTSKKNPNTIVSAYKDNVAFIEGPQIEQFAPKAGDKPSVFNKKTIESVISLKAETHNFPTTVEPFNGAATGSGGEIRDRLAGGKGSRIKKWDRIATLGSTDAQRPMLHFQLRKNGISIDPKSLLPKS